MNTETPILEIRSVSKDFRGLRAVDRVSLTLRPNAVTALLGANGAGKTTLFNCITGQLTASRGEIIFRGKNITQMTPHSINRLGISRSFQITNIFPQFSVFDNVRTAVLSCIGKSARPFGRAKSLVADEVLELLETVGLVEQASSLASTLSYGDQRIMEVAIALATRPQLLLLDEPTAGMSPEETHAMVALIKKLSRQKQLPILLVEHDMDVVFSVSEMIAVLHEGRLLAFDTPDRIRANQEVQNVYLGEETSGFKTSHRETAGFEEKERNGNQPQLTLEVKDIDTYYGLSHVLFKLSLMVRKGELVCLLGRNGAGKTTTLKSIMGLLTPQSGSVKFKGKDVTGKQAYEICAEGVGFVFGDRRIFPGLTTRQNLEVGWRPRGGKDDWTIERVFEVFPRLKQRDNSYGATLSGGEQQMLAIARALMGNPELLLLDEPSEGLAPLMVRAVGEQILHLRDHGIMIVLAEQNVKFALEVSSRGYVIDKGKVFFEGTVEEIRGNEEAQKHLIVAG
jgi:ABC-type branched-subunit amino acid transport system ATPase component